MKSLRRTVERFCYNHPRFGIPNFMTVYIIICAVVFLVYQMDRSGEFISFLYYVPSQIAKGEIWRLVTWIFIPADSTMIYEAIHLLFYFMIGRAVQAQMGNAKFMIYYLTGMIIHLIYATVVYFAAGTLAMITPVFLNLSLFFIYAVMYPENRFLLFFVIPIKVKWLALFDAAYYLYKMIRIIVAGYLFEGLLPLVGMLVFLLCYLEDLLAILRRKRPVRYVDRANTIDFRKASREHERQEKANPGYRHKCAVCGRTDAEHPELEFRYCSRCKGYHCFCMDHINNHIHFTE